MLRARLRDELVCHETFGDQKVFVGLLIRIKDHSVSLRAHMFCKNFLEWHHSGEIYLQIKGNELIIRPSRDRLDVNRYYRVTLTKEVIDILQKSSGHLVPDVNLDNIPGFWIFLKKEAQMNNAS